MDDGTIEGIIESEGLKRGYRSLRAALDGAELRRQPLTGVIKGWKLYDQTGGYLFALHVRPHHLLFYLRRPALDSTPSLQKLAREAHTSEQLKINRGEEMTIRLRSEAEAVTLIQWLIPQLPLQALR